MKSSILTFIVFIVISIQTVQCVSSSVYSDRVVAVVNNDVILESDLKKHKQPFMRNIMNLPLGVIPPGKWPTEKEILDELIVIRLLEQEAVKKGINLDDKAVEASIESIRKRNNLSQDQFVLFLAANDMTYADYKKIMTRQFKLTRLIDSEVTRKVPMSEDDAQKYFIANRDKIDEQFSKLVEGLTPARPPGEQVKPDIPTHEEMFIGGKIRLRQITLKIPSEAKQKDVQKVMEISKRIFQDSVAGGDFAKLAQKYSQDPNSKNGGDLGFISYKDMVPGLQKMVQRMKPGDVTPPLKTKDAIIMFYLADAQGRQVKKVPLPEKTRKEMEKRWKEAYERRDTRQNRNPDSESSEENELKGKQKNGADSGKTDDQQKKPSGILSALDEKEYEKVKNKVISIVRNDKIQTRMKEWLEQLKKNSIIDVKL
ncbi:MAG: peptidylprolyl isomerase [Desulfomonile sp.]